jgi:hypothetical protein
MKSFGEQFFTAHLSVQTLVKHSHFTFIIHFCHSPSFFFFFTFPAVPSALLALCFASGSHDAPRAGPEK